ncbi:hypothetical protein ISKNV_00026 [Infectious spleen and kidney necrosis virus]|nr:hypothetical protein ISKNV_00026 [Infectious spleen and kidney necrosis virus]
MLAHSVMYVKWATSGQESIVAAAHAMDNVRCNTMAKWSVCNVANVEEEDPAL